MDWLDVHAGSVQAIATLVLVTLTAYYAWTTRALAQETRRTVQTAARATLQERMDRISEIFIREPELFTALDDPDSTGRENDARFFIANMFLGVLEEAFMQYALDHTMTADDWGAWAATADSFVHRPYVKRYWQRVGQTYEPSFQRWLDARIEEYRRQHQTADVPTA
jgi:hypothetical protein